MDMMTSLTPGDLIVVKLATIGAGQKLSTSHGRNVLFLIIDKVCDFVNKHEGGCYNTNIGIVYLTFKHVKKIC